MRRGCGNSESESDESDGVEISCGQHVALLYRNKYGDGNNSDNHCVLVKDKLYTLDEFLIQSKVSRQKDWKKVISINGLSLNKLMKDGLLPVHNNLCSCAWCSQNVLRKRNRERKRGGGCNHGDGRCGSDEDGFDNENDSDYEVGDEYKYVPAKRSGTPRKKSKIKLRPQRASVRYRGQLDNSSSEDVSSDNSSEDSFAAYSLSASSMSFMSLRIPRVQTQTSWSVKQDREANDGIDSDDSNAHGSPQSVDCRSSHGSDTSPFPSMLHSITADSYPDAHLDKSDAAHSEDGIRWDDEKTTVCVRVRGGEEIDINWETLLACPLLESKVRRGQIRDEINLMSYGINAVQMLLKFIVGEEIDSEGMDESDVCGLIELACDYLEKGSANERNVQALIKQIITEDNVVSLYSTAFTEKFHRAVDVCKRVADGCDLQALVRSAGFRNVVSPAVSHLFDSWSS